MRSFVASVSVVVRRGHSRVAQDAVKGCRFINKFNQFFFSSSFFWEEGFVPSFLMVRELVCFFGGSPFFRVFLLLRALYQLNWDITGNDDFSKS